MWGTMSEHINSNPETCVLPLDDSSLCKSSVKPGMLRGKFKKFLMSEF